MSLDELLINNVKATITHTQEVSFDLATHHLTQTPIARQPLLIPSLAFAPCATRYHSPGVCVGHVSLGLNPNHLPTTAHSFPHLHSLHHKAL